jgi:catechol 2,3-dioxygenase-like lactoylglutathione lyase family enzyme
MTDPNPGRAAGLKIDTISHLVVTVSDRARGSEFYKGLLGFSPVGSDMMAECGAHQVLAAPSGQRLILAEAANRHDLRETGVHQAYSVTASDRERIVAKLAAEGNRVLRYKEDQPAEANDNYYLFDPDGNRIQLVAGARGGIHHACVQVSDILWSERFYRDVLGFPIEHRVGWKTADYIRARKWANGEEDMAPGTRRLDKRYTVMVNRATVPRVNMQLFFRAGDAVIGTYLANKHFQEPPEEQLAGVPRIGLAVARHVLDDAAKRLSVHGRPFLGPTAQPASSPFEAVLYFKDMGGNFLELCTPRRGATL